MKILHVLDHSIPLHSGYTFRTRAILRQQHAQGWVTDHITSPKHYGAAGLEETVDGLHFFRTPPASGVLARLPVLNQLAVSSALAHRLEEIIDTVKPDILHAHSPALNGLAAVKIGARHGIPVVYEVRAFWEDAAVDHGTSREWGPRYRATRAMETRVLRRADAVTTICEGLRSDIVARGIPAAKVTVIPNAVDADRFSIDLPRDPELVAAHGLEGAEVVGFIGSFYAYEGLDLLIEALPAVLAVRPEVKLLLVGGGPQEDNLRAQAAALGVADRVIFTGRVPHEQVDRYYALVDVFAYPRWPMRLTELVTPLKPLEAMAQGRILLASDVGGHKELIRDGETGRLFRAGDAGALADGLLGLLAERGSWPAMRAAGRHYVETERNWPVSVARYGPIYEALSGGGR